MKKLLKFTLLASMLGLVSMSGCVVSEVRGPAPCAGGVWIRGHYDRFSRWHRGHWRCPGVVEVEIR